MIWRACVCVRVWVRTMKCWTGEHKSHLLFQHGEYLCLCAIAPNCRCWCCCWFLLAQLCLAMTVVAVAVAEATVLAKDFNMIANYIPVVIHVHQSLSHHIWFFSLLFFYAQHISVRAHATNGKPSKPTPQTNQMNLIQTNRAHLPHFRRSKIYFMNRFARL